MRSGKLCFLIGAAFIANFFLNEKSMGQISEGDRDISKLAKKRQYPGGSDESDLRVQTQLPSVSRKLSPDAELPVENDIQDQD